MNWRPVEASYGAVEEIEWPDLWDDYERAVRGLEDAHQRPCEEFGISEEQGGPLIHQLRLLDPKGEYVTALKRWQSSLHKAEDALRRLLKRLPEGWRSAKVLDRIARMFDFEQCTIERTLVQTMERMHADNEALTDLIAFAKTQRGFDLAIATIQRVGTKEARDALAKVAISMKDQPDRLAALNDAAVAISVHMEDPKVIPLLVNRLTAAYANAFQGAPPVYEDDAVESSPTAIIILQMVSVIEATSGRLNAKLLQQLSRLGLVDIPAEEVERQHLENPHLGVEQAVITRDLMPVRSAASRELERRQRAS